jgi:hypothetical protein
MSHSPKEETAKTYLEITSGTDLGLSARLTVNLNDYMSASLNNKENSRSTKQKLDRIRASIVDCITGLSGACLWEDMLTCAISRLSEPDQIETKKYIDASAAGVYMRQSFIELVKNSMDQIVLSDKQPPECVVQLDLFIEVIEDMIRMTFSDNGGGFTAQFIEQMNDDKQRKAYIDNAGSSKFKHDLRAELFGGAGRGLRILCAYIDYGDKLERLGSRKEAYIKPDISRISFSNHRDGVGNQGATIVVETSKSALCQHSVGANSLENNSGGSTTPEYNSGAEDKKDSPKGAFRNLRGRLKKLTLDLPSDDSSKDNSP